MAPTGVRRFRESAWYACYLAVLTMLLSVAAERPAYAQCPLGGSPTCQDILQPCPIVCYIIKESSDTTDFLVCNGPPHVCRSGTCYVFGYSFFPCSLCAVEYFGECACCIDA
jgi:hypothetical protein